MIRTQIDLTDEQAQDIKRRAQREKKPANEVTRRALVAGLKFLDEIHKLSDTELPAAQTKFGKDAHAWLAVLQALRDADPGKTSDTLLWLIDLVKVIQETLDDEQTAARGKAR